MAGGVNLYDWQRRFVDWDVQRRREGRIGSYLAADVGTGKTIAALASAKANGFEDVTVIAPLSAHDSWLMDGQRMGFDLKVGKDIFTYEKFTRMPRIPVTDFLILDEAHRAKNPSAKVTKRLIKYYLHQPKLLLSGTPQDRLHELYSQYKLVEPDIWDGWSWTRWKKHYFHLESHYKPKELKMPSYKDVILDAVDAHTFRVSIDEVMELPGMTTVVHTLPKNTLMAKKWREFEADILNPVTSFIQEYAIGQGIDPESKEMFDRTKLDWVLDFIEDNPKTIVFSYFRTPVVTLRNILKKKAYYVLGDDKKDLQDAIIHSDRPLIATYALKEGANLQGYRNIVYLSLPLAFRDYYQSRGRIYRSGQKHKVVIHQLRQQRIDYEVERLVSKKMELHEYVKNRKPH